MSHPLHDDRVRDLVRRKAWSLVGKAGLRNQDVPDLEQELSLWLWIHSDGYAPTPETGLGLIRYLLNQASSTYLRDRSAAKRRPPFPVLTLNDPLVSEVAGQAANSESDLRDLALDVADFLEKLAPRMRLLAEALMRSSLTEVARDWNMPRSTLADLVKKWAKFFEK